MRKFEKKHALEIAAVLVNFNRYHKVLEQTGNPQLARDTLSFVHRESFGVSAITQKGAGPSKKQLRLYVFPDLENEIIHVLTLGDKNTQQADNNWCGDVLDKKGLVKKKKSGR